MFVSNLSRGGEMIKLYNFSEGQEDAFLISIENKKLNILVDGGNGSNDIANKLKQNKIENIDYIVLTHIDQDHINGLIKLLEKENFSDFIIVYNKFIDGNISFRQAECFEKIIKGFECIVSYKNYQYSKGEIIFLSVEQRKLLEKKENEIYFTFFSPNRDKVKNLYDKYTSNHSGNDVINRSSIIFLLEYKNDSILMTGDGYISDIVDISRNLADDEIVYSPVKKINLIKIPHHGSELNNEKLNDLLNIIECEKFIITNKFINYNNSDVVIKENLITTLEKKYIFSSSYSGIYQYKSKNKLYELKINKKDIIDL